MMRIIAILFAFAGCGRPAPSPGKTRLVAGCSSSSECKTNSDGCSYCYNGQCSCSLPAEPIPGAKVDAGVDALGGN